MVRGRGRSSAGECVIGCSLRLRVKHFFYSALAPPRFCRPVSMSPLLSPNSPTGLGQDPAGHHTPLDTAPERPRAARWAAGVPRPRSGPRRRAPPGAPRHHRVPHQPRVQLGQRVHQVAQGDAGSGFRGLSVAAAWQPQGLGGLINKGMGLIRGGQGGASGLPFLQPCYTDGENTRRGACRRCRSARHLVTTSSRASRRSCAPQTPSRWVGTGKCCLLRAMDAVASGIMIG